LAEIDFITHSQITLRPDPSRTVVRPFAPDDPHGSRATGPSRAQKIANRVLALDERQLRREVGHVVASLRERHRDIDLHLMRRFAEVNGTLFERLSVDDDRARLIAAYFCAEYSFEAAALFNPSLVAHPDQSGMKDGAVRFIMSLRGIGEGHMSSVTFRTGNWQRDQGFVIDPASAHAVPPQIEAGHGDGEGAVIELGCSDCRDLSETVLFPVTQAQRQGLEDLRLVRFTDEQGAVTYLGTYTAFDGRSARSELLSADNFQRFTLRPLTGTGVTKGMALFPRKLDGDYAMLGRLDNESIWLLRSPDILRWNDGAKLVSPRFPWEFFQLGNCGPPIELEEGWLVLIHGVGTVRNYCIGACLLDRDDPSRLLARTPTPLLEPGNKEREGYVPNVVYSCGGMVHDRTLLMAYGVADSFATFATMPVDRLLAAMR
jgi:predicted GH43/DUF377 family glycosyl hydrolase